MPKKTAESLKTEKYSARYWANEITSRLDAHQKFFEEGQESINVYSSKHKLEDIERKLNCWWYVVNTMLPAYYSSTPKVEINLRKRAGSSIYQLAAVCLERRTQWEMDESFDFDALGYNLALQFLLVGRAVVRAGYEAEVSDTEATFKLIRDGNRLIDANGNPYTGDAAEVVEGPEGLTAKTAGQRKEGEKALLDLVQYNDFLQSDGRNESETTWRARRAFLTEEQCQEKGLPTDDLSFDAFPEATKKDQMKDRAIYNGRAELWEIECRESDKVYWLQARGDKSILEEGEPPLKFEDFYSTVVINASIDPDSTIPTSDFVHCRDQILLVERLTTREHALIQAVRTNFAYDATMSELEKMLDGDLKGIPVKNWPSYKQRGGLAAGMEFGNIDPYVKALQVVTETKQAALQQLYETMKASDLLRGVSDPNKTATANRLENQWSSLGLIVRQNMFANFIGEAIGKLGTVIAQQFSAENIFAGADADELLAPLIQQPDPQNPMAVPPPQVQIAQIKSQINQIFKNESDRCYHIKIASDSMVALDERQERQDGVDLMQSAGSFFQQMKDLVQQYPPLLNFSMQLFQNVIRRYRGGKELEPIFMDALQKIAEQQQAQASQAPPQDPAMVKAQTDLQIAQLDSQDKHQTTMVELRKLQVDSQLKQQAQQFDQAVRLKEIDLKAQEVQVQLLQVQGGLAAHATQAQLKGQEIQAQTATDMIAQQVEERIGMIQASIDQQKADTDAAMAKIHAIEKLQEEKRLAEVELGHGPILAKEAKAAAPAPVLPPIHIHVGSGKRIARKLPDGSYEAMDVPAEELPPTKGS